MHSSLQEALDIIKYQQQRIESLEGRCESLVRQVVAWGNEVSKHTKTPPETVLTEESTAEVREFRYPDDDFA